jgi:hypothetical protein
MAGKKNSNPKTRDYFMVAIINGVTKSAVHVDRKKKANKLAARKRVKPEENK